MKSKGRALICRGVITLCGSSRIAFWFAIVKKQFVRKAYKLSTLASSLFDGMDMEGVMASGSDGLRLRWP
jgi:hypothetical protein